MYNQIIVLAEGYSRRESFESKSIIANCSSVLIKSHCGKNIIVDTMTAWDGDRILKELEHNSVDPKNINYVVCTHGHSDHIGCNYLFTNAERHVVGKCISKRDQYLEYDWDQPFQLVGTEIQIVCTPGHTLSCVSLLVKKSNLGETIGICGDLFENEKDIWDSQIWIKAGSEDPKLQRENRSKLANLCSYIIPGHGPGFAVTADIRNKLQKDLLQEF